MSSNGHVTVIVPRDFYEHFLTMILEDEIASGREDKNSEWGFEADTITVYPIYDNAANTLEIKPDYLKRGKHFKLNLPMPEDFLAVTPENRLQQGNEQKALTAPENEDTPAGERVRQGKVEPMSENTLDDTESVSPVFEGALNREALAEALKTIMAVKGLSVRKAAEEIGTNKNNIQRSKDAGATVETTTEFLNDLGYDVNVSIVPKEEPS